MLNKLGVISPEFFKVAQHEQKSEDASAAWAALNTLCWAIGSISGAM